MNKKKLIPIIILILVFVISGGFIFTQRTKSEAIKEDMKLANKYVQDGKYEEAELALLKVISVEPKNVEARIQLADVYITTRKYDKAKQVMKDAETIAPNNTAVKNKLDEIRNKMTGNTPGNIANGGLVAKQGDWIYYINLNENSYTTNIFKIKTDGSSKTRLNNSNSKCLNVLDDSIYYISYDSSNTFNISRMGIDGSNNINLIKGEHLKETAVNYFGKDETNTGSMNSVESQILGSQICIYNLNVSGNKLYFTISILIMNYDSGYLSSADSKILSMIVSCNIDGTEEKVLCKFQDKPVSETECEESSLDIYRFIISGEYIYFYNYNDSCLCRVKKDSAENAIASYKSDRITEVSIGESQNNLFYLVLKNDEAQSGLFKVSKDLKEKVKISDEIINELFTFNVSGDYIYYSNGKGIYRLKADGSGKEAMYTPNANCVIDSINIADEWIYFTMIAGQGNQVYGTSNVELYRIKSDGTGLEAVSEEERNKVETKLTIEEGLNITKSKIKIPEGYTLEYESTHSINGKNYYLYLLSDEDTTLEDYAYCVEINTGDLYKTNQMWELIPIR